MKGTRAKVPPDRIFIDDTTVDFLLLLGPGDHLKVILILLSKFSLHPFQVVRDISFEVIPFEVIPKQL